MHHPRRVTTLLAIAMALAVAGSAAGAEQTATVDTIESVGTTVPRSIPGNFTVSYGAGFFRLSEIRLAHGDETTTVDTRLDAQGCEAGGVVRRASMSLTYRLTPAVCHDVPKAIGRIEVACTEPLAHWNDQYQVTTSLDTALYSTRIVRFVDHGDAVVLSNFFPSMWGTATFLPTGEAARVISMSADALVPNPPFVALLLGALQHACIDEKTVFKPRETPSS